MSRALVLVDHGSRVPEAHEQLERLAARLRRRMPGTEVAVAHMELATPSLADAVEVAAERGARQVLVYPLFLAPGRHLRDDIPKRVESIREARPELDIRLLPALGEQEELVEVVLAAVLAALVE